MPNQGGLTPESESLTIAGQPQLLREAPDAGGGHGVSRRAVSSRPSAVFPRRHKALWYGKNGGGKSGGAQRGLF